MTFEEVFSCGLMEEGFMGDVHPPLRTILISDFVLKDTKKFFCKCYQNYLRHLWLKFFIFQISWRWFRWHPEGVVYIPPHNSGGVILRHICHGKWVKYTLCMDLKLGMYNDLDMLESFKKFWGISDTFDLFMTSSMSGCFVILQFLATASVIKFVETLDFHIEYVFW